MSRIRRVTGIAYSDAPTDGCPDCGGHPDEIISIAYSDGTSSIGCSLCEAGDE